MSYIPPWKREAPRAPKPSPKEERTGEAGLSSLVSRLATDLGLDVPMDQPIELRMTVAEARELVTQLRATKDGVVCPVCGRGVHDHLRTAGKPMASFMHWLVANYNDTPLDIEQWKRENPHHARGGSTYSRARWWGLAMRERGQKPLWSPTLKGKRWAWGIIALKSKVTIRDNVPIAFDGPELLIHEDDTSIEPQRGGTTPDLPGLLG